METLKQIPPFFKPKSDEHYPTLERNTEEYVRTLAESRRREAQAK
jgi:hypothetical protein